MDGAKTNRISILYPPPVPPARSRRQRSVVVRKTRARYVCKVVYLMGPGRVLSGVKDLTDKLLPTVAEYLQDSSLETRYPPAYDTRVYLNVIPVSACVYVCVCVCVPYINNIYIYVYINNICLLYFFSHANLLSDLMEKF